MNTLIAVAGLGILVLLLEIFGARKTIVPITVLGLLAVLGLAIYGLKDPAQTYYNNMIHDDIYSRGFSCLFITLTIFLVTMSHDFYKSEIVKLSDFITVKLFLLFGGLVMVSFGNLATYFVGIEILSVSLYVLAASNPKSLKSNEAGMKYFLMGAFASGFLLFGMALIYGATGTFDIMTIRGMNITGEANAWWFYVGIAMVSTAMLFKIAAVPFHLWAPDVYEGSPALTTALMSTLAKGVAMAGFYRLIGGMLGNGVPQPIINVFMVVCILSMTVGNIMALRQHNVKRMLAFSGISHAGFMLSVLLLDISLPNAAILLYYTAAYALAGIAAFAVIVTVCKDRESEDIAHFNGLGKSNPLLAGILTAALLSMAGIPIFAGFFAKVFLFGKMLEQQYIILVIVAVINSIISVGYYFKIILAMYTKEPLAKPAFPLVYTLVAVVAIALNIVLGVWPDMVLGLI